MPEVFGIGKAVKCLKEGLTVARMSWVEDGVALSTLGLRQPDDSSDMTEPYIFISVTDVVGKCPWIPNQQELLAEDWLIVSQEDKAAPNTESTGAGAPAQPAATEDGKTGPPD
jgi:hypothetical protein